MSQPLQDCERSVACAKCQAQPGEPCRTPTGRQAWPHLPRRKAYRESKPTPTTPLLRTVENPVQLAFKVSRVNRQRQWETDYYVREEDARKAAEACVADGCTRVGLYRVTTERIG